MKAAPELPAGDISQVLPGLARRLGERPAVVQGGKVLAFRQLEAEVAALARGLTSQGICRGARAALMVPPGPEFAALTFALLRAGAVPVLVDPGIGWKNLGACLAEAAPVAFLGSWKAHAARVAGGWAKASVKRLVCAGGWWPGALALAELKARGQGRAAPAAPGEEDVAAVLFTSGSTGAPKGVVYTHSIFKSQAGILREMFSIGEGETSVATFPLFALFDVALGMTAVIPDMDASRPAQADPAAVLGAVRRHRAGQLFASPALLAKLGRYAEAEGLELSSLKRVISAGAPVSPKALAAFAKVLPEGCEVHTPYGATEALPVAVISSRELLGEAAALSAQGAGTCVGRPVPGMEIFLIRVTDEPIPRWSEDLLVADGEVGEIVVRGPVVTPRYDARPRETAQAKIPGPDGVLRHRMGDLGRRDGRGRLWFCGRKSQRVVTPGGTLYTVPCEGVFNAHPQVRRSALVGAGPEGMRFPALCVELEAGAEPEAVRPQLLDLARAHEATRRIATILFHPGFPVDARHNAKIDRERLSEWASARAR